MISYCKWQYYFVVATYNELMIGLWKCKYVYNFITVITIRHIGTCLCVDGHFIGVRMWLRKLVKLLQSRVLRKGSPLWPLIEVVILIMDVFKHLLIQLENMVSSSSNMANLFLFLLYFEIESFLFSVCIPQEDLLLKYAKVAYNC